MTTKRKKQFETPVGKFSYLYCPKTAFHIGIQLDDAGDQKKILIASPEKALCDIAAAQTRMSTKNEMMEFLGLMRLDFSVYKNLDFSLLEEIKTGYHRQSIKLLLHCLKDYYV